MKLLKMTFPLFLFLIPLLLGCTVSEIFDVFGLLLFFNRDFTETSGTENRTEEMNHLNVMYSQYSQIIINIEKTGFPQNKFKFSNEL